MKYRKYNKYVGQYVKRFYNTFEEKYIWKISGYREVTYFEDGKPLSVRCEFGYSKNHEEFWTDVEDSVIITNEEEIIEDERVANIKHPNYKGFNPFLENPPENIKPKKTTKFKLRPKRK